MFETFKFFETAFHEISLEVKSETTLYDSDFTHLINKS